MTVHISSLIVAVGIVVLASLLAPEGKQKKWVNFVLGLVAFSVLSAPLLQISDLPMPPLPSSAETVSLSESPMGYMLSFTESELEKMLSETFGIPSSHIYVHITPEEQGSVRCVEVTVDKEADKDGIGRYLHGLLGKEWEVIINGR